jgi:nucleotide-binding universal stress UspA family protein
MTPISHILFPYDFSQQGKRIAPMVRAMAAHFNAQVTLYSVVPPVWEVPPAGMRTVTGDTSDEWKRSLQAQLDTALRSELAGVSVDRVADAGDPAARIHAYCESHDVDLVMMPTRGHGAFRSFLLGSVTTKVLHDVACPVWTSSHNDAELAHHVPTNIVCAVDRTDRAVALCRRAIELAGAMNATLRLVHVAPIVTDFIELDAEKNLQDRVRQSAETGLRDALAQAAITVPLDVMAGEIGPCVAEYATCEKSDLVIAARGAINEPFGRFRAHTADIVAQSPCPVLSI